MPAFLPQKNLINAEADHCIRTLALEIQKLTSSAYNTAIDTHKEVRSAYDAVLQTQDDIHEVGKSTAAIHKDIQVERIMAWLAAPDPSTNYFRARRTRQSDTGLWFLKGAFNNWTDKAQLMWLYGKAGCGKTVLSSTIITEVLAFQSDVVAVAYFYFDFNNAEKQDPDKMICSLITQLHAQSMKECKPLTTLFSLCKDGQQRPDPDDLLRVLEAMMQSFDKTYIILDALDECSNRHELLEKIEMIQSWQLPKLHMLLTSRSLVDIEEALKPMTNSQSRICIQSAAVNADIELYVTQRLRTDRRLKRWQNHAKAQREIKITLKEKADGMSVYHFKSLSPSFCIFYFS